MMTLWQRFVAWLKDDDTESAMGAKAKTSSTLSARVIRADGTVEELGIIARGGRPARRRPERSMRGADSGK